MSDSPDDLAAQLDSAPEASAGPSVQTVARELGPKTITVDGQPVQIVSQLLTTSTLADRVESSVRTTFADGKAFSHCVYDAHLDRVAQIDGINRPQSAIAQLSRVPANEGAFAKQLREARLLLALRVDRGAPAPMIAYARHGLEGIEIMIRQRLAQGVSPPPPPPSGAFAAMSPAVRVAAKLSLLAFVSVYGLRVAFAPMVWTPPEPVRKPEPESVNSGWFYGAPPVPTTTERTRYESTTTRTTSKGVTTTTVHSPVSTTTVKR